jgi:hypothetical protein
MFFIAHFESRRAISPSPNMVNVPRVSSGTKARQSKARNAFIKEVEGTVKNHMTMLNGIADKYGR